LSCWLCKINFALVPTAPQGLPDTSLCHLYMVVIVLGSSKFTHARHDRITQLVIFFFFFFSFFCVWILFRGDCNRPQEKGSVDVLSTRRRILVAQQHDQGHTSMQMKCGARYTCGLAFFYSGETTRTQANHCHRVDTTTTTTTTRSTLCAAFLVCRCFDVGTNMYRSVNESGCADCCCCCSQNYRSRSRSSRSFS